ENTDHEIKRLIPQLLQIRRIAFLKRAVGQAMLRGALIPSLHQVARDIDAQHVRSEFSRGQCRRAIAASEVQDLESFCDSESLHERLPAFAHGRGNAREVAFFPECFVWIHTGAFTTGKQIGQLRKVTPLLPLNSAKENIELAAPVTRQR